MTDAAGAKMSGGRGPKDAEAPLDQPTDAIGMTNIGEAPAEPSEPSDPDASKPTLGTTSEPASGQPVPPAEASSSTSTGQQEPTIPWAAKGKEKAPPSPPAKNDEDDMAIGGPTEDIAKPVSKGDGSVCVITLLLPSGAKHPYRLDEKYLTKRNVSVPGLTDSGKKDPFSISVYTLKELILREWRDEWDPKPSSPSSIRLIHFGKLLDDRDQLKQYHFSAENRNVVHMSVKPQDIVEEDEPKGSNATSGSRNRSIDGRCCCVVL